MSHFEGSYLGDAQRIDAGTRMECGVCWWVYDPRSGDAEWQIAPGTPFAALPAHWRCPRCDAAPGQFMALGDGSVERSAVQEQIEAADTHGDLRAAYEEASQRMSGLPVFNTALTVEVIGSRTYGDGEVCVVITPWMMNLALLPAADAPRRREGTVRNVAFPSGAYAFTAAYLENFGPLETCSLFSPMERFDDPAVARQVAQEALSALFVPATEPVLSERPASRAERGSASASLSRRELLRGAVAGRPGL